MMLLRDVLFLSILSVTVATTTAFLEEKTTEMSRNNNNEKKLMKREAIILDNYPESVSYNQPPKVIYRRLLSRHKNGKPKPKYGLHKKKYGPPKHLRTPQKKYRRKPLPKYEVSIPTHIKRPSKTKTRYGLPKSAHNKSKLHYGIPKIHHHETHVPSDSTGFGEPPTGYTQQFKIQKQTYGEPPSDIYGANLKTILTEDKYPTAQEFSYEQPSQNHYTAQEYSNAYNVPSEQLWQSNSAPEQNYAYDNRYAIAQKYPTYTIVNKLKHVDNPLENDIQTDVIENPEPVFNPKPTVTTNIWRNNKQKPYYGDKHLPRTKGAISKPSDQIIVGGQYAEPPARYVPKFQPSATMSDHGFFPTNGYLDSEVAGSAVSSYVNYKNSNLAFSPQNLNDAFGIID